VLFRSAQVEFDGFSIQSKAGFRAGIRNNGGYAIGGKFSLLSKEKMYSISYIKLGEFNIFSLILPEENANEINVLIGKFDYLNNNQTIKMEFQVGMSVLWGLRRGEEISYEEYQDMQDLKALIEFGTSFYEHDDFVTVGLPVHIGLRYNPWSFADLGLDLDMNINMKSSYLALGFSMSFGRMPKPKIPTE